jgi:2-polyprenyl-3-methyl-5-hydroxy-6-metoxy-1,4-benzoquinol methylase
MQPAPTLPPSAAIDIDAVPDTDAVPGAGVSTGSTAEVQVLTSIDELEGKLEEVDRAWAVSDDAMRAVFQSFVYEPADDAPADPYSPEYAEHQFALYRLIADRPHYEVQNERSDFPVDANRPFPYYTESPETVGHTLMAIGFIVRTMGLPAGSSILELGPGWGNTTIELARMGYDVTAVDIDPAFVGLIAERADKFSLDVDARQGTFLEIDRLGRRYDAVLFFECFHHCSDHRDLVAKLAEVITPGGRVFFAAEPVVESFPVPWGVRTDGESLWAIRRYGWLELGFQESYFLRMLAHAGWVVTKHTTDATHLGVIFEARRADGSFPVCGRSLPPDEEATWLPLEEPGSTRRYSQARSELSVERYGAYTHASVRVTNTSPLGLPYRITHGRHSVTGVAPAGGDLTVDVPYDPEGRSVVLDVETWRPAEVLQSADLRTLGLLVTGVTLR